MYTVTTDMAVETRIARGGAFNINATLFGDDEDVDGFRKCGAEYGHGRPKRIYAEQLCGEP